MPTVDIPDRICSHCGGIRWNIQPSNNKITCVVRLKERTSRYYQKNKEHVKKRIRQNELAYFQDPIMKKKLYHSQLVWKTNNPNKVRKYRKITADKERKVLSNDYVKRQIVQYTDLKFSDIPQDLVELKRKQLSLKRQCKNVP